MERIACQITNLYWLTRIWKTHRSLNLCILKEPRIRQTSRKQVDEFKICPMSEDDILSATLSIQTSFGIEQVAVASFSSACHSVLTLGRPCIVIHDKTRHSLPAEFAYFKCFEMMHSCVCDGFFEQKLQRNDDRRKHGIFSFARELSPDINQVAPAALPSSQFSMIFHAIFSQNLFVMRRL